MKSKVIVAALLSLGLSTVAMAEDAKELAGKKSCLACHAIDAKVVGPGFKEVAKKYEGQKDAEAKLAEKVLKGGAGVWGQVAMPANPITPEESHTLVKWILSLK